MSSEMPGSPVPFMVEGGPEGDDMDRLTLATERLLATQQAHYEIMLSNERAHSEQLRAELVRGHRNAVTADHIAALRRDSSVDDDQGSISQLVDALVPVIVERVRKALSK